MQLCSTSATVLSAIRLQWYEMAHQKVRMYYRSGTGIRYCIGAKQTPHVHSPGGISFLCEMTSWLPSWKRDVKWKIWLRKSLRIYLKNIPAKFHPDPIWNDGADKNKQEQFLISKQTCSFVIFLFHGNSITTLISKHTTQNRPTVQHMFVSDVWLHKFRMTNLFSTSYYVGCMFVASSLNHFWLNESRNETREQRKWPTINKSCTEVWNHVQNAITITDQMTGTASRPPMMQRAPLYWTHSISSW